MEIVMRGRISGARDGVDWPDVGGSIDVPAAEAHDLVAMGLAAYADDDVAPLEAAVAPKAETAADALKPTRRTPRKSQQTAQEG